MRQLLTGPFTDGEVPDDLFVKFTPDDKDFTGYVVSIAYESGGTPGNTGSGTELAFAGTSDWADEATGLAFIRFAVGDLDLDSDATGQVWRLIQLWAHKAASPVRKTATIAIGFFVEPAAGGGGP